MDVLDLSPTSGKSNIAVGIEVFTLKSCTRHKLLFPFFDEHFQQALLTEPTDRSGIVSAVDVTGRFARVNHRFEVLTEKRSGGGDVSTLEISRIITYCVYLC